MPALAERSIRINVSRDGLCAQLVTTDVDPARITEQSITSALQQLKIPIDPPLILLLKQIDQAARSGQVSAEPILLAEGRVPVEGTDARFELAGELAPPAEEELNEEARADFHRSLILTVDAGTTIGTLVPEVPPVHGVDVFGKPITAAAKSRSIKLGSNLQLAADNRSVVATAPGKVHITRQEISVLPVVEVAADVDFSTGDVEAGTDVLINGTIRDSFHVTSSRSITVRGAIEGAEVHAGTELQVNGGIASRNQGKIIAGGEIFTKFCNDTRLEAGGDITVAREALNSTIRTQGRLLILPGKLIGGKAYAREGAEIYQLGNEANIKTEIALGVDPLALLEVARADELIHKKQEAIAKIRQSVQPLMAQLKRLTPAQRERATELLYQADSMEQEVTAHQQQRTAALRGSSEGHELVLAVHKAAYAGASIIFGDKVATLHQERKGPFKVVCRAENRVEEILLIDKVSGSVSVLGSREYRPHAEDASA